jgi:hypothetical protein
MVASVQVATAVPMQEPVVVSVGPALGALGARAAAAAIAKVVGSSI